MTIYAQRLDQLRGRMADQGLDHLIVSAPENMYYLTGYDGWSFYLHQCLIVSRHSRLVFWVGRGSDVHVAAGREAIGADNVFTYPDTFLQSDKAHPYDFVAEVILRAGLSRGRVGVPLDGYYFSPAAYFALERGLDGFSLVSDAGVPNWQRAIKSEDEIVLMREAARIAGASLLAGVATVAPGVPTSVTAGAILSMQTGASIGRDGGYPSIAPLIIDGNGPAVPHHTWSAEPHPAAGPCIIEIAGVHKRYHAPLARTVFRGDVQAVHREALAAQEACMRTIEEAACSGTAAGDLADLLAGTLRVHGFERSGRFGYSTGIAYPPDWGEHTVSIRAGEATVLREGMTLFFIPALWRSDWSVAIGDTYVVRSGGAERLSDLPYVL